MSLRALPLFLAALSLAATTAASQSPGLKDPLAAVPDLRPMAKPGASELADIVARYGTDQAALARRYDGDDSPEQRVRFRGFYGAWRTRLAALDFERLSREGQVDYLLLDNHLRYQLDLLDRRDRQRGEAAPLLPFADRLLALQDARRSLQPVDPPAVARLLAEVTRQVDSLRALLEPAPRATDSASAEPAARRAAPPRVSRTVANRAAEALDRLRGTLGGWYRFAEGYDPMFTWWVRDPWQRLDQSLTRYAATIRERLVGIRPSPVAAVAAAPAGAGGARGGGGGGARPDDNTGPIIGDPIGAEGLAVDLRAEMIPYTAEELIAIAEREYAFSLSEIRKAARELGFGDDWKRAMDKVKDSYVAPGEQPALIRRLALEAEAYFDQNDLITIPPLAKEVWRMEMMTPERQRVAPFFLGGEVIQVSYPTDGMTHEEKLMSMRGNNPHFSHATVFHELIPGHHLQQFMIQRYHPHRRQFQTPFWNEGAALYWEMFLWDRGFHASAEDRIGALFWRMHRSARIIFSLNFHLGKMTPEQAIQFLVDTVNFERANAEGEVRRSFSGQYSPLYQAAYMLGGLQLRALREELVGSGRMTDRTFHDAVYQGGPMPIAMVRARLTDVPLRREGAPAWRFGEQVVPPRPAPFNR
jgi:uncharacterized protein (DUF885 family)